MRTIATTFQGTVPKLDAKLLPDPNGQQASNIDVSSGALCGLRDSKLIVNSLAAPTSKYLSLYRYDYDNGDPNNWLAWETDVSVCEGPLADDTYSRIYMSGATANGGTPPQMRYVHLDDPGLFMGEYRTILGCPAPTTAPTIATALQSSTSWNKVWGYWWEETDGTRNDIGMYGLRRPALNGVAALIWKPYRDAFTFEATLASDEVYPFPGSISNVYYQLPAGALVTLTEQRDLATLVVSDKSWCWAPSTTADGGCTLYIRSTELTGSPDAYAYNSFLAEILSNQSMDAFCNITETTAGVLYSLPVAAIPIKIKATASAKFVMRMQAYTATGAMLGQLYPDISAWGAESDLYVNGAKVAAKQTNTGTRSFTLSYNTQSTQYYSANRTYIYTRVSLLGEESEPSDPSNELSVAPNLSVNITGLDFTQPLPPGYTTAPYVPIRELRIYRTVTSSGGTLYQYTGSVYKTYSATQQYYAGDMVWEDSISNYFRCVTQTIGHDLSTSYFTNVGGTLLFVDNITDAEVGEAIASIGWTMPEATWTNMVSMPGAFLAMHDGHKTIYFSEPNYPHAWPIKYGITLDYVIKGLAVSGNTLIVGTEQNPYLITVTDPANATVSKLAAQMPCTSKRSLLESGGAVFYSAPDGVVSIGGAVVTLETEVYLTKAQWWDYQTDSARAGDSVGGFHPEETMITVYDDTIYVFCAGGNFTFQPRNYARGVIDVSLDPSAIWLSGKDDALYYIPDLSAQRQKIYDWMAEDDSWQATSWQSKRIASANYDLPAVLRVRATNYPTSGIVATITGKAAGNTITVPITDDAPIRLADFGTLVSDEYFSFALSVAACTTTRTQVTEVLIISRETVEFDGAAIIVSGLETPQLTWRALKFQFPRCGVLSSAKVCAQKYPVYVDIYADDVLVRQNVLFNSDNAIRLNDLDAAALARGETNLIDGITWEVDVKGDQILYDITLNADVPTVTQGTIKFVRASQQMPVLRAMSILSDKIIAFTVGKVVASGYSKPITFKLYCEDWQTPVYTKTITDGKAFRLPILRKSKNWELDIVSPDVEVIEVTISNSMSNL